MAPASCLRSGFVSNASVCVTGTVNENKGRHPQGDRTQAESLIKCGCERYRSKSPDLRLSCSYQELIQHFIIMIMKHHSQEGAGKVNFLTAVRMIYFL